MQKIYLSAFLLIITLGMLRAQTPTISISYPPEVCLGQTQKIQVSLAGSFKADNKFTIQVRRNDDSPVVAELPATLVDGLLEVVHKDSSLSLYQNVQMRAISSSPKVESSWVYFRIHSKGTVSLNLSAADTINAGEGLQIRFTTFSSSSAQITLNDSSRFSVSSYAEGPFMAYHQVITDKTDAFYIAHAENVCGAMKVSGQVKATINSTSLRTINISPSVACEDSEIKISYSTLGPALTAQTRYRIKFTEQIRSDDQFARAAEVVAELRGGFLVAKVPAVFKLTGRTDFKVQIITESPNLMGSASNVLFAIVPKASVEFVTPSLSINVGSSTQIGVNFKGQPPFMATLSDGTMISSGYSGQVGVDVRPGKTTSYSLQSFSSGCSDTQLTSNQVVAITVKEGIYLDSDGNYEVICVGTKARVKIVENLGANSSTTYMVHGVLDNQKLYSFPATRVGDYLEFTVSPLTPGIDRKFSHDNMRAFYVSTKSPVSSSNYSYKYVVQSAPDMVVMENSVLNYTIPGRVQLGYYLYGRGPFVVTDDSGKDYLLDYEAWYPDFYLNKTTDFKIKSISNSCFRKDDIKTVRLTLNGNNETAPALQMEPLKTPICLQDSIEITFSKSGKFNDGNVFSIQGYSDCCGFQTLTTVSDGGKYKVKIPAAQYSNYAQFRVTSSNPVLFSDQFQVEMQSLPTSFYIYPQGTAANPVVVMKGENVELTLSNQGGALTSFVYSDGTAEKTANFNIYKYAEKLAPPVGVTTAYTIKSATNQCGTVPLDATTYIRVLPYRILISDSDYSNFTLCVNGPMTIPFGIVQGDGSKATFSLEMAREGGDDFTTLVKGISSRQFETTVPGDLSPGIYLLRITSSDGAVSSTVRVGVGAAPTATLVSERGDPIMVNAGEYFPLKLNFTGSAPWTVVFENNTQINTTNNPDYRSMYTFKGGDYFVKTVYNGCGYGTASGKIAVKVKPQLSTSSDSYSVCQGGTYRLNYNLLGDADISNDYVRFELVEYPSLKVVVLDSVKAISGTRLLKIPDVLPGSSYNIRVTVRSLSLEAMVSVIVNTKADITMSGNTVVNSGESTNLIFRTNKNSSDQITYKLSDGTTGTIYTGWNQQSFYVKVTPAKTTTYTLTSVSNSCGQGVGSGSAVVEVNAPSERSVTVTNIYASMSNSLCTGDTALVNFSQKGNFSANNIMTVQISDTTGKNFRSIPTFGQSSPLKAALPADMFALKSYRVRVIASDANTASGASADPLLVNEKAKARFAAESVIYDGIVNPKIVVLLSGGGPWQYQYGTDLSIQYRYSNLPSDTITLLQASPNQYYKLFSVTNNCGKGIVENPATVRVEVITANEPAISQKIIVAPNPTQDFLLIKFESSAKRNLTLFNSFGLNLHQKTSRNTEETIDLRNLPSGVYILNVETNGQRVAYKVVKQ